MQISVWANSPASRDAFVAAIDPLLADTPRIALPDNTWAHVNYMRSPVVDDLQKEGDYRRDLFYNVEFGTTRTDTATQVGVVEITTAVDVNDSDPGAHAATTYL